MDTILNAKETFAFQVYTCYAFMKCCSSSGRIMILFGGSKIQSNGIFELIAMLIFVFIVGISECTGSVCWGTSYTSNLTYDCEFHCTKGKVTAASL